MLTSRTRKKRRFKKRYIPLAGILILFIMAQAGMFAFRKSDAEIKAMFEEAGLPPPDIHYLRPPSAPDRHIRYAISPNTDAPALVVCFHGSPGSMTNCFDFLKDARLTAAAQVAIVDRAGFGYSDLGRAECSLEQQAAHGNMILDNHAEGKRVILLGHSFGGPVIARMAMDYPDKVDGLVIVAGSISPDLEPHEPYRPVLAHWSVRWLIPKAFQASNLEIMALRGELEKMSPLWENISVPVTVLQGEKDGLVPKGNADFAQEMLVNSPKVAIDLIPDGNHFIFWSLHDRVVDRVLELL